ncbi:hypothetical protein HYR99_31860 [Candidatus Poribacteria bacterium]|nr:hypothetical protein [Candidatus Poribacteria bacterium]
MENTSTTRTTNRWNDFRRSTRGRYRNAQEASVAYRFRGSRGATVQEIINRIPGHATKRALAPIPSQVTQGVEYKWADKTGTVRVRIHGPNPSSPIGSNARKGWIVRIQRGGKYLDHNGFFHHRQSHNPRSPYYNPTVANDTHIPLQTPAHPGSL